MIQCQPEVGASLQAWQRKIDSELREGSNSSASVALMGLVGSRFEQTEKLGDGKRAGSGDRAAEESEEDWTVAKKDDNFKKGVDVGIPVYDHKEAVVSVLYDPMAVTNQDHKTSTQNQTLDTQIQIPFAGLGQHRF